jgi:hypothetical protein
MNKVQLLKYTCFDCNFDSAVSSMGQWRKPAVQFGLFGDMV